MGGVIYLLVFFAGALIGGMIGYFAVARRGRMQELSEELERVKVEYSAYRGHVGSHFSTSAELVQEMTLCYKAVYDHLADGARELSPGTAGVDRIEAADPRLSLPETEPEPAPAANRLNASHHDEAPLPRQPMDAPVVGADGTQV